MGAGEGAGEWERPERGLCDRLEVVRTLASSGHNVQPPRRGSYEFRQEVGVGGGVDVGIFAALRGRSRADGGGAPQRSGLHGLELRGPVRRARPRTLSPCKSSLCRPRRPEPGPAETREASPESGVVGAVESSSNACLGAFAVVAEASHEQLVLLGESGVDAPAAKPSRCGHVVEPRTRIPSRAERLLDLLKHGRRIEAPWSTHASDCTSFRRVVPERATVLGQLVPNGERPCGTRSIGCHRQASPCVSTRRGLSRWCSVQWRRSHTRSSQST